MTPPASTPSRPPGLPEPFDKRSRPAVPLIIKIIIGFAGFWVVVVAGGVVYYQNCEECQEAVANVGETMAAVGEASNSPAAKRVQALGCDQALVLPMARLSTFITPLIGEDDMEKFRQTGLADATMVMCKQQASGIPDGPECADVARAYGLGFEGELQSPILVVVQGSSSQQRRCTGLYAPDGTFLGEPDF